MCPMFVTECLHNKCLNCQPCVQFIFSPRCESDMILSVMTVLKMDIDEKCASFGTRLEQKLNQVSLQYPNKISETMYWNCVRERFFHGLPKDMRTNLRTQFDSGATYYQILEMARIVESENFHENSGKETKSTSYKGKSKIAAASVDNSTQQMQQIQQLQDAVKGLTKLLQNNPQQTQLPQISQFVPQTGQQGTQENVNTLPQATNGQGSTTPQRGRGGRGGYRGRGGRGRGGLILCYWCRDFLPKEQANHKVAQCPYQNRLRMIGGKINLVLFRVMPKRINPLLRKTSKGNYCKIYWRGTSGVPQMIRDLSKR